MVVILSILNFSRPTPSCHSFITKCSCGPASIRLICSVTQTTACKIYVRNASGYKNNNNKSDKPTVTHNDKMHTTEQGLALLKILMEKIFFKTTQHSQKRHCKLPFWHLLQIVSDPQPLYVHPDIP
jgi:hypothetical protein